MKRKARHNFTKETRALSCLASQIPPACDRGKFGDAGLAATSGYEDATREVSLQKGPNPST